jgi:hypothetical protein
VKTISARYLMRNIVEPATMQAPSVQLEHVGSASAQLVAELPISPPDGQNAFMQGDVLFSKLRPYLAKSLLVTEPLQGTGEFLCLRPTLDLDSRFLKYLTLSRPWLDHAVQSSYGSKMPRTSWDQMASFQILDIRLEEQRRIADFLDDRVTRIDKIVAARQQQSLLLKTERANLWDRKISQVPHHSAPVRHLASKIGSGKTPSGGAEVYVDDGVPLLRSQNVHNEGLKLQGVALITSEVNAEMRASQVFPRDVLLNITGASLGRCTWVPDDAVPMNVNQHVCIIRPTSADSATLCMALQSHRAQDQIRTLQVGGNRDGLNFEQVGSLIVDLPIDPDVTAKVNRRIRSLDELQNALARQEALLQEYKQSLITAAVTGEFDVTTASKKIPE